MKKRGILHLSEQRLKKKIIPDWRDQWFNNMETCLSHKTFCGNLNLVVSFCHMQVILHKSIMTEPFQESVKDYRSLQRLSLLHKSFIILDLFMWWEPQLGNSAVDKVKRQKPKHVQSPNKARKKKASSFKRSHWLLHNHLCLSLGPPTTQQSFS